MKDNDLITCREAELVLLEKGQRSRRYMLGDVWELNFDEIREALSKYQPKIVRCGDCKYFNNHPMTHGLHYGECDNGIGMVNHDWFCADGERKEQMQ